MACFTPRQEAGENGFGERELVTKAATRERWKPGVKRTSYSVVAEGISDRPVFVF